MSEEGTKYTYAGGTKRSLRPVIVVLLISAVLLPISVLAVRYVIELRTEAGPTEEPKNVEITNVSDTSATISWITPGAETVGYIQYGTGPSPEFIAFDVRDDGENSERYTLHYVTIQELNPDTIYYFVIVVGGKEYKNDTAFYEFQTGPTLPGLQAPLPVIGEVDESAGTDQEYVVYVYAQYGENISNKISVLTNEQRYSIDLSNLRSQDLTTSFSQWEGARLYFLAQGFDGSEGTVVSQVKQL